MMIFIDSRKVDWIFKIYIFIITVLNGKNKILLKITQVKKPKKRT